MSDPDVADFDFRHASLTRLSLSGDSAELEFTAVHTLAAFDWWDVVLAFPLPSRVEFGGSRVELPVHVAWMNVRDAANEHVPGQRLLDVSSRDPGSLWLRIRFSSVEIVAQERHQQITRVWVEPPPETTVTVRVRVATPEQGGRHTAVFSGYRPDWWIGHFHQGEKALNGAEVTLLGREWAFPGETIDLALRPTSPEFWTHLVPGAEIEMREGRHVCGYGTVLDVRPA